MNHRLQLLLICGLVLLVHVSFAQNSVGIGTETPNTNAVLHLVSPGGDQGFIVPQLSSAQRTATSFTENLSSDEVGMLVFDTDDNLFYYWDGSQWSSLSGQTLSAGTGINVDAEGLISNTGDLDDTNEIQDLSLSENILTITSNAGATSIDLTPYLDNSDNQTLTFSDDQLTISGGNAVNLSALKDGTGSDDQTASEVNVTAAGNLTSTNVQDALIEIQTDVDGFTDTDDQTLTFESNSLSISDGNSVDLSGLIDDADADPENELQDLNLDGNTLSITGLETPTTVDLSPYIGNNTDNQTLSLDVENQLSITGGNSVDLSSVGIQNLEYDSRSYLLSLSGDETSIDLSDLAVDGDSDDSNEIQSLILDGTSLGISGGNNVDLSGIQDGYEPNTDNQTLSFNTSTNLLSIVDGNSVNLSTLKDGTGTDNQDLSYDPESGELSITNGTSVNIRAQPDGLIYIHSSDFTVANSWNNGADITYDETGAYMYAGQANTLVTAKAKVELPNGAIIKNVEGFVGMSENTSQPGVLDLKSLPYGDNKLTPEVLKSGSVAAQSGSFQQVAFSLEEEVDNSANLYYLYFTGPGGPEADFSVIHYVRISYSFSPSK